MVVITVVMIYSYNKLLSVFRSCTACKDWFIITVTNSSSSKKQAGRTWSLESKLADISHLAKRSGEEATDNG